MGILFTLSPQKEHTGKQLRKPAMWCATCKMDTFYRGSDFGFHWIETAISMETAISIWRSGWAYNTQMTSIHLWQIMYKWYSTRKGAILSTQAFIYYLLDNYKLLLWVSYVTLSPQKEHKGSNYGNQHGFRVHSLTQKLPQTLKTMFLMGVSCMLLIVLGLNRDASKSNWSSQAYDTSLS